MTTRANGSKGCKPNPSAVTQKISEVLQTEQAVSVSDVSLISSDGARFPSIRALLILRSPFFEKLLTSDFAEKGSSEVHISLRATPLRNVLEFIYTDDCAYIRGIRCEGSYQTLSDVEADGIIELAVAADYVHVPKLVSWCKDVLLCNMRRESSSLCINVQKLNLFSAIWASSLKEFAMKSLVESWNFPLVDGCDPSQVVSAVVSFDGDTLEDILKHIVPNSQKKQEVLFQVLLIWTNGGYEFLISSSTGRYRRRQDKVFVDVSQMNLSQANRLLTAKRIAQIFDLTKFSAKVLDEVVEESGICNLDDILGAYRVLALNAENRGYC